VQEKTTTLLDVLGILLIAGGIGALVFAAIAGDDRPARWLALTVAGLVVLAGSALAAWLAHRAGAGKTP
jgi:hypothetical protein